MYRICLGNLILSAALIPGYLASFAFIDVWGRKPIQFMGFTMLTILFLIMGTFNCTLTYRSQKCLTANSGFGYDKITPTDAGKSGFFFLYCLANFFQNFGPNTTTFIIPGEVFPTRYRSTAHGISSASGKLGAIIAQIIFIRAQKKHRTEALGQDKSLKLVLVISHVKLT